VANLDPSESAFLEAEVEAFAPFLQQQARNMLLARNIKSVDEALLRSLSVQAAREKLTMLFADHGRMHDMGAGRGYHLGKFAGVNERGAFLKGRKPSKWYTRLVWGTLYKVLAPNIANKYIAEVPGELARTFREGR